MLGRYGKRRLGRAAAGCLLAAGLSAVPAAARDVTGDAREFANPPAARPQGADAQTLMQTLLPRPSPKSGPTALPDARDTIAYVFDVQETDGTLFDPWTGRDDKVRLRSYRGTGVDPKVPFMAPTITMRPDQTVRITLNNRMDPNDPSCPAQPADVNTPHCFNTTNLHAHGLWVSPSGNSDNVLVAIRPGVSFQYEYNVPDDHASGTFWYHPHMHGSTALQVSSGMAGALIVKAERVPTADRPGDLDILMEDRDGQPFAEKVLLFQQIHYACRDKDGKIKTAGAGATTYWACDPGEVGQITAYDQFGPKSNWPVSGRFTSINGRVQPTLGEVQAGRFERWRLLHAGVGESVTARFYKIKDGAPPVPAAAQQAAWMKENCGGDPLPFWEVALDWLTRPQARRTTETVLQPGYRADVVTYFPEAGRYCLVDDASGIGPNGGLEARRLLGIVEAAKGKGAAPAGDVQAELTATLVAAAERAIADAGIRKAVVDDLRDGLKLSRFVWHRTLEDAKDLPVQQLVFNIAVPQKTDPDQKVKFQVDGQVYDPARIDRKLVLGAAEEWVLRSNFVGHPFHIHVNPFQIISITDPRGRDVSAPGAVDDYVVPGSPVPALPPGTGNGDPQYPGMKGVWKDTIWIKNLLAPAPGVDPAPGRYTITVRTRYERYIGEFVLHCHILDHEDQGMMQNVSIGVPDGKGGTAAAHAHGSH